MTDPPNTPPTAGLHEETARLMELVHAQTRIVCGPDNVLDPLAAHCAALDAALKECEEELVSLDLSTKERCERLV